MREGIGHIFNENKRIKLPNMYLSHTFIYAKNYFFLSQQFIYLVLDFHVQL